MSVLLCASSTYVTCLWFKLGELYAVKELLPQPKYKNLGTTAEFTHTQQHIRHVSSASHSTPNRSHLQIGLICKKDLHSRRHVECFALLSQLKYNSPNSSTKTCAKHSTRDVCAVAYVWFQLLCTSFCIWVGGEVLFCIQLPQIKLDTSVCILNQTRVFVSELGENTMWERKCCFLSRIVV